MRDSGAGGAETSVRELGRAEGGAAGAEGTTSLALRRSSGTSRYARMRALSSFASTSVEGVALPVTPGAGASIAICEMSRREATSSSAGADGCAALNGCPDTGADSAGALATARRLSTVPAPRRIRSSTTSCVFCFSRLRFSRSTASASTELMWFRTSVTPID
ncbi:MAG: hypothetical protein KF782_10995 [Labilithrix sp.]|nr:hypothetical protein [Labilithrix sp.]